MLASPKADLIDPTGKTAANYIGPPDLWTHMDGSTVVGSKLAVAPALGSTNVANQLSKGVACMSAGTMQEVSYIQRINTKGGAEFSKACGDADIGDKLTPPYQTDYIFWKPIWLCSEINHKKNLLAAGFLQADD